MHSYIAASAMLAASVVGAQQPASPLATTLNVGEVAVSLGSPAGAVLSQLRRAYKVDSVAIPDLTTMWVVSHKDATPALHSLGNVTTRENRVIAITQTVEDPASPAALERALLLASTPLTGPPAGSPAQRQGCSVTNLSNEASYGTTRSLSIFCGPQHIELQLLTTTDGSTRVWVSRSISEAR
jgi:hypothetical protein